MDVLVFLIEDQQYGLDLNKVHSVVLAVETTALPNAPDYFLGAINVHGQITVVLNMRKLLGWPIREVDLKDQFIICNVHQKQVALWVDSVKSIKSYSEDKFITAEQVLPDIFGLQYILKEDNQIILIYDLEKLVPSNLVSLSYDHDR